MLLISFSFISKEESAPCTGYCWINTPFPFISTICAGAEGYLYHCSERGIAVRFSDSRYLGAGVQSEGRRKGYMLAFEHLDLECWSLVTR